MRSYTETPDESYELEAEDTDDTFSMFGNDATEDSLQELKKEVESLKTQVKGLKRIILLNVFESKRDFYDFFADIW